MSFHIQSSYGTAAANTDVYVNLAAAYDTKTIKQIVWSLSGNPAAAIPITIESPVGTVLCSFDVTTGGPGYIDFGAKGLKCGANGAVQVLMDLAASTGAIGKLTVIYDTE